MRLVVNPNLKIKLKKCCRCWFIRNYFYSIKGSSSSIKLFSYSFEIQLVTFKLWYVWDKVYLGVWSKTFCCHQYTRGEHFSEVPEEPRKITWHPIGLTARLLQLASLCAFLLYMTIKMSMQCLLSPGKKRSPLFFCLFLSLLLTLFSHNQKLEERLR